MSDPNPGPEGRNAGFSLIELMVVVIVLAILAATIVPKFTGATKDAKISRAKSDLKTIESALEFFSLHMDRYPTTEEGLSSLVTDPTQGGSNWKGPYIKEILPDPWDRDYHYACPGSSGREYDLLSYGADGEPEGEGDGEDVTLWRKEKKD